MPIVTEEELDRASLVGTGFSYARAAEAMKNYPRETKAIMDTLAEWRKRLRGSALASH